MARTGRAVRLSAADRAFLRDLARVGIIDIDTAGKHHYAHLQTGGRRSLERLEQAGLLTSRPVRGHGVNTRAYTFAGADVARAFGGVVPVTGTKRSDLHELVTSRLFFELGRPDDFRLAADFDKRDALICGDVQPDAMYTGPNGETVFVEADSGQYSKAQIRHKQRAWRDVSQVWGQPPKVAARVPHAAHVKTVQI